MSRRTRGYSRDVVDELKRDLEELKKQRKDDVREIKELKKQRKDDVREIKELKKQRKDDVRKIDELQEKVRELVTIEFSEQVKRILLNSRSQRSLVPRRGVYHGYLSELNATETMLLKKTFVREITNAVNKLSIASGNGPNVDFYRVFHLFWFVCPLKLEGGQINDSYAINFVVRGREGRRIIPTEPAAAPRGTTSQTAVENVRNIHPDTERIDPSFFWKGFGMLHELYNGSITPELAYDFWSNVRKGLEIDPAGFSLRNEAQIEKLFHQILVGCTEILSVTGLRLTCSSQESFRQTGPELRVTLDLIVTFEGEPLAVFETKHEGLHRFLTEQNELRVNNEKFKSIVKQCSLYMSITGLTHIFITDFFTTILLVVNSTGTEADLATDENGFNCGYKFYVIKNSDTPVTLQSIISSMLVRQLAILFLSGKSQRTESIPNTLKTLIRGSERTLRKEMKQQNVQLTHLTKIFKTAVGVANYEASITSEELSKLQSWVATVSNIVDVTKFQEVVKVHWDQEYQLHEIQVGSEYLSDVYSFEFNSNWVESRLSSEPEAGSKMILKVYNIRNQRYTDPKIVTYFQNEIVAFARIQKHNKNDSGHTIGVPEIYDYGLLTFFRGSYVSFSGFYLLMAYVEDEEDSMGPEEVTIAKKRIDDDIKSLETIGISHGDIKRSNMRINKVNPMPIDYSHATTMFPSNMEFAYSEGIASGAASQISGHRGSQAVVSDIGQPVTATSQGTQHTQTSSRPHSSEVTIPTSQGPVEDKETDTTGNASVPSLDDSNTRRSTHS